MSKMNLTLFLKKKEELDILTILTMFMKLSDGNLLNLIINSLIISCKLNSFER